MSSYLYLHNTFSKKKKLHILVSNILYCTGNNLVLNEANFL